MSGGPNGLEPVLQSGHGLALILILVAPILWAGPVALMTAELASAIPEAGGFVVWVHRALGAKWGFLCGWWTWLYAWLDVAIYPGLFAVNLGNFLSMLGFVNGIGENSWLKWAAGLIVIVPFTLLNLCGIRPVGKTNLAFGFLLALPFGLFIALALPKLMSNPSLIVSPMVAPGHKGMGPVMATGLFTIMWNYLGWDSISTVAGEVEDPKRNFPRSIFLALFLIMGAYLLPTVVGNVFLPDPSAWKEGAWSAAAAKVGGQWLAIGIAFVGLVASMGLFSSALLTSSRIPYVLGRFNFLPAGFTRLHARWGTPATSILVSALFYTVFSFQSFETLRVADVLVYSVALVLELVALVLIRIKEPNLPRPYKIPGGWLGLSLVVCLPVLCICVALGCQIQEEGLRSLWLALGCLATGPLGLVGTSIVQRRGVSRVTSRAE